MMGLKVIFLGIIPLTFFIGYTIYRNISCLNYIKTQLKSHLRKKKIKKLSKDGIYYVE